MDQERRPESPGEAEGTSELFSALGKQIRVLRERAGLTQREFGRSVGYGEAQVSAMERGVRIPQPDFLDQADELLSAGGLLSVAKDDVRKAQAKARTRHPAWYRDYAKLEAEAIEFHNYNNQAVHGLLQTEDYARAIFTHRRPLLNEETVETRVADRLARQQILERWTSATYSFVLEEVILQRPVGGRSVLDAQLRQLLRIGRLRNVEIQVLPTDREEHPNMDGSFTLITTKSGHQVAYTEIQGYPRLITTAKEVRHITDRYGIIRAQALTPRESLSLIEKMLGEL
ncbi:Scr1 family TA system antitoxin-like transcriptional regulator [Streptomyces sp. NPDC050485]|uniref:helix-turn-helix domain-containing protein n=1 Tax=Streptomyces sp. NPDC050485 TaxID=3365617 RepID=UPI003793335F